MNKWYAIYTKPRWEKKVFKLLYEKGIETYCPLNKVRKKWSDRYKIIEEPLFKSYVFVKILDKERTTIRVTPGVVNFVYWNGKPAIIKDAEIERVKRFLNDYDEVEVYQRLHNGDEVIISSGPLMDRKGKILEVKQKQVKIVLENFGFTLVAYVKPNNLITIKQKPIHP